MDEIGQYIGDNSGLMLNLQTVVEELGSKCLGKVWVIVTSQEDIDSVTHVKGNDFSKIQGRFNTRLSLSSASVDEVIKRSDPGQNRRRRYAACGCNTSRTAPSCAICFPLLRARSPT